VGQAVSDGVVYVRLPGDLIVALAWTPSGFTSTSNLPSGFYTTTNCTGPEWYQLGAEPQYGWVYQGKISFIGSPMTVAIGSTLVSDNTGTLFCQPATGAGTVWAGKLTSYAVSNLGFKPPFSVH
jgi:hypothetical protein